jgi:plasmid stabilization system protein ParE
MPRIVVAPLAQADIDEIWDYIALDSIPNADRFVDRIKRRFDLLADNPGDFTRRSSTWAAALHACALSDLLSTDPGRNRSGSCGPWGA